MMRNRLLSMAAVMVSLACLSGCASSRRAALPVLDAAACVRLKSLGTEEESRYVVRRAHQALAEYGFKSAASDSGLCGVTVSFTALDAQRWEVIDRTLFGTKQRVAWRAEGFLTLTKSGGEIIAQDEKLDVRDAGSKIEMLDTVVDQMVDMIKDRYRPAKQ